MNKIQLIRSPIACMLACALLTASHAALANDSETPPTDPPKPTTCLSLIKEVSPTGDKPWFDANTEAEAVDITATTQYRVTLVNCGEEKILNIQITDPLVGFNSYLDGARPDSDWVFLHGAEDICKDRYGLVKNTATATGTGEQTASYVEVNDVAWVNCGDTPPPPPGGGEGCTPGYWKQDHHFDSWPAGITPGMSFQSIFNREITVKVGKNMVTNPTLLQALMAQGGNVNAAARHTVAAYLNANSTGVDYDLAASDVVSMFQSNYPDGELDAMKNTFEGFNEQGCPLN